MFNSNSSKRKIDLFKSAFWLVCKYVLIKENFIRSVEGVKNSWKDRSAFSYSMIALIKLPSLKWISRSCIWWRASAFSISSQSRMKRVSPYQPPPAFCLYPRKKPSSILPLNGWVRLMSSSRLGWYRTWAPKGMRGPRKSTLQWRRIDHSE